MQGALASPDPGIFDFCHPEPSGLAQVPKSAGEEFSCMSQSGQKDR